MLLCTAAALSLWGSVEIGVGEFKLKCAGWIRTASRQVAGQRLHLLHAPAAGTEASEVYILAGETALSGLAWLCQ
jgi:hypothetical protein